MKKLFIGTITLAIALTLVTTPVKVSAATNVGSNEAQVQLLMQIIALLQQQLALLLQNTPGKGDGISGTVLAPQVTAVGANASPDNTIYVGESAWIKGTGLNGLITVKIGSKTFSVNNGSNTSIDFMVPTMSAGRYMISVTNDSDQTSPSYGYVTVVVPRSDDSNEDSYIDSSYTPIEERADGGIHVSYSYNIPRYHSGLVLDVEPTVVCSDRDCSRYLFGLTNNELDEEHRCVQCYLDVPANPYVVGGASYRFTGESALLSIIGYVDSTYTSEYIPGKERSVGPIPDSVEFKFVLRNVNQGGKEIWAETKVFQFKG